MTKLTNETTIKVDFEFYKEKLRDFISKIKRKLNAWKFKLRLKFGLVSAEEMEFEVDKAVKIVTMVTAFHIVASKGDYVEVSTKGETKKSRG